MKFTATIPVLSSGEGTYPYLLVDKGCVKIAILSEP